MHSQRAKRHRTWRQDPNGELRSLLRTLGDHIRGTLFALWELQFICTNCRRGGLEKAALCTYTVFPLLEKVALTGPVPPGIVCVCVLTERFSCL